MRRRRRGLRSRRQECAWLDASGNPATPQSLARTRSRNRSRSCDAAAGNRSRRLGPRPDMMARRARANNPVHVVRAGALTLLAMARHFYARTRTARGAILRERIVCLAPLQELFRIGATASASSNTRKDPPTPPASIPTTTPPASAKPARSRDRRSAHSKSAPSRQDQSAASPHPRS